MFEDILEGYQEPNNEEKTPGIPEYEDPTNIAGISTSDASDDDWDTYDEWNAGESWSTSDDDEVWRS